MTYLSFRGWTHQRYYVNLVNAFLHGRLYLENAPDYPKELVRVGGRAYVSFPPMPAVLEIPEVALFGLHEQQTMTSIF